MKMSLLYFLVIGVLLTTPLTTLCDFITEDGIKVQLFKSKSKKPISLNSYYFLSENEYSITVSEPIEKILLNGYFDDNLEDLSYKLTVFNEETKSIVLFKDTVEFTISKSYFSQYRGKEEGTTYSLPLSPWIMSKGKYLILIERNNMLNETENRILSIKYIIK